MRPRPWEPALRRTARNSPCHCRSLDQLIDRQLRQATKAIRTVWKLSIICGRHGRRYVQVMDVIVDDALAAQRNRPPEPVCVILTAAVRQRVVEAADWVHAEGSVVEQLQQTQH